MVFEPETFPENAQLKEWFSWRATAVTEHQQTELINKLGDEIVMRAHFLAYIKLSRPAVRLPDGRARIEAGTQMTYYTLTSKEQQVFYPVFTDVHEMEAWTQVKENDPMTVVVSFDDFAPILHTNPGMSGIVINPFSDSFPLLKSTIMAWTEQKKKIIEDAKEKQ